MKRVSDYLNPTNELSNAKSEESAENQSSTAYTHFTSTFCVNGLDPTPTLVKGYSFPKVTSTQDKASLPRSSKSTLARQQSRASNRYETSRFAVTPLPSNSSTLPTTSLTSLSESISPTDELHGEEHDDTGTLRNPAIASLLPPVNHLPSQRNMQNFFNASAEETVPNMMSLLSTIPSKEAFKLLTSRIEASISWFGEQECDEQNEIFDNFMENYMGLSYIMNWLYSRMRRRQGRDHHE